MKRNLDALSWAYLLILALLLVIVAAVGALTDVSMGVAILLLVLGWLFGVLSALTYVVVATDTKRSREHA